MPDPVPLPTPSPRPGPRENGSDGDASGNPVMNTLPAASGLASSSTCRSRGTASLAGACFSARLTMGTVSRSCPIARARDGGCGCRFPPPPPPPLGPGCSTNTSLGTCGESVTAFTVTRALGRDHAASESTTATAAMCTATAATPPLPAERDRAGSRGDGNARHRSERSPGTSVDLKMAHMAEEPPTNAARQVPQDTSRTKTSATAASPYWGEVSIVLR